MDLTIASFLAIDGLATGAIYSLMAIAIVLIFSVTRILFIPQGEFIVFGAATLAQLQAAKLPSVVWLLLLGATLVLVQELWHGIKTKTAPAKVVRMCLKACAPALIMAGLGFLGARSGLPLGAQVILTVAMVAPLGSLLYRLVYASAANSSVLTLLIISVGVHFGLSCLALAFLGPEGFRTPAFAEGSLSIDQVSISGQAMAVMGFVVLFIGCMFWLFTRTFLGLRLRAVAVNQIGARLVGLSVERAGALSLGLAAALGAFSGVLIAPTTTIFYDTGFLIGLKGFVAAVFAGLASFPLALVGALLVGLIESFSSFWASAFKEAIVFTAIVPILLWRSIVHGSSEEH